MSADRSYGGPLRGMADRTLGTPLAKRMMPPLSRMPPPQELRRATAGAVIARVRAARLDGRCHR
jgi:hypothetical protein